MSNTHNIRKQREREARMDQEGKCHWCNGPLMDQAVMGRFCCNGCAEARKRSDYEQWKGPILPGGSEIGGRGVRPVPDALEVQISGSHYKAMKIQPIEYIHANGLGFAEGCVVKYITRHRAKNGVEDLRKARHFIDLLLQLEYGITGEGV